MIDPATVLARANEIYAERKLGTSALYCPPEARPVIQTNQVKAAIDAMTEAVNTELARLQDWYDGKISALEAEIAAHEART